jgi:hypothetical protein
MREFVVGKGIREKAMIRVYLAVVNVYTYLIWNQSLISGFRKDFTLGSNGSEQANNDYYHCLL